MSSSRTDNSMIAARYATALFSLADHDKALDAVDADLQALGSAIRADANVAKLMAHPLIARSGKAEAMASLLKAKKAHALTQQAIAQVAQGGRLSLIPEIADAFRVKLNEARGVVNATVISARPLDAADEKAVAKALKDALGKDVQLTLKTDVSLIGGLKIRLGGTELDMSLNAKLERMKRALIAA